jgi:hypothetical protein
MTLILIIFLFQGCFSLFNVQVKKNYLPPINLIMTNGSYKKTKILLLI